MAIRMRSQESRNDKNGRNNQIESALQRHSPLLVVAQSTAHLGAVSLADDFQTEF